MLIQAFLGNGSDGRSCEYGGRGDGLLLGASKMCLSRKCRRRGKASRAAAAVKDLIDQHYQQLHGLSRDPNMVCSGPRQPQPSDADTYKCLFATCKTNNTATSPPQRCKRDAYFSSFCKSRSSCCCGLFGAYLAVVTNYHVISKFALDKSGAQVSPHLRPRTSCLQEPVWGLLTKIIVSSSIGGGSAADPW